MRSVLLLASFLVLSAVSRLPASSADGTDQPSSAHDPGGAGSPGSWNLTKPMVESVVSLFSKPYPNAPEDVIHGEGLTVYRPNHGLAQATRVATLTGDISAILLHDPRASDIQSWLRAKTEQDPVFLRKLAMIALTHRSGRVDESDSIRDPTERVQELEHAAENFRSAAAGSGISFTGAELAAFSDAIKLDGKSSDDRDRDHLSRILRGSHVFDLWRLGWHYDEEASRFLPELSADEVSKMFRRAEIYFDATGDLRYKGGAYTQTFLDLSTDPDKLVDAIHAAQASHPIFP